MTFIVIASQLYISERRTRIYTTHAYTIILNKYKLKRKTRDVYTILIL